MRFFKILALASLPILAIGVWELRTIRKNIASRWDYDRMIKCLEHERGLKGIHPDAKWFCDGVDAIGMELLGKPHDLKCSIQRPWSYFERKERRTSSCGSEQETGASS